MCMFIVYKKWVSVRPYQTPYKPNKHISISAPNQPTNKNKNSNNQSKPFVSLLTKLLRGKIRQHSVPKCKERLI